MNIREFYLSRKFFDDANYPYGMARSGDFTIKESDLMEKHGCLLQALAEGLVTNPSEEDLQFVAVVAGNREPQSALEKLWMKYQDKVNNDFYVPSMGYEADSGDDGSSDDSFDSDD